MLGRYVWNEAQSGQDPQQISARLAKVRLCPALMNEQECHPQRSRDVVGSAEGWPPNRSARCWKERVPDGVEYAVQGKTHDNNPQTGPEAERSDRRENPEEQDLTD
jgi:hypothetical protein